MLYDKNCLEIRLYRDAALGFFEFINDFVQVSFLNEAYLSIDDPYWTEKSSIIRKFHKLHLIFNEELDFEHRGVCWVIKTFCVGKEIVVVPAHTANFKTCFAQAIQVLRCSSIGFRGFSEEDAAGLESMRKTRTVVEGFSEYSNLTQRAIDFESRFQDFYGACDPDCITDDQDEVCLAPVSTIPEVVFDLTDSVLNDDVETFERCKSTIAECLERCSNDGGKLTISDTGRYSVANAKQFDVFDRVQ